MSTNEQFSNLSFSDKKVGLIDSFLFALAKQSHFETCVAPELVDAGCCSTKRLHYYEVLVHVVGRRQLGTLPSPEYDRKMFDYIRLALHQNELYGDRAYKRPYAQVVEKSHINVRK